MEGESVVVAIHVVTLLWFYLTKFIILYHRGSTYYSTHLKICAFRLDDIILRQMKFNNDETNHFQVKVNIHQIPKVFMDDPFDNKYHNAFGRILTLFIPIILLSDTLPTLYDSGWWWWCSHIYYFIETTAAIYRRYDCYYDRPKCLCIFKHF